MFQSFDIRSHPELGPARLSDLRAEMGKERVNAFLISRADVHQGEYVAPRDERLNWLTGFAGSAGFCAATNDQAGVFIDGRYRVQVKSQIDLEHYTPVPWPETQLGDWLIEHLPANATVAYDPWLHGYQQIDVLQTQLGKHGISLKETDNLVDRIWADQPEAPMGDFSIQPVELAGENHSSKRERLAEKLRNDGHMATVITLPDSIAWLLNIRGTDVAHNPIGHAFAILHASGKVSLFVHPDKCPAEVVEHLGSDVQLFAPTQFETALKEITGKVLVDQTTIPMQAILTLKHNAELVFGSDPCILPKARKNSAEIAGMREAHLRDGAAMVEFLTWLDTEAPKGTLTEIGVVKQLESFRRATNALKDISFETISATGPHGAICHYRVSDDSNLPVEQGQLLLVDSGGQYQDGTTDITRTMPIGEVGIEEKQCFTRVLQGMIAMSRARWPEGLAGRDLDAIARYPLWVAGQDYDHGTGHGVGAFLSVHEGPVRLSRVSEIPLESGMILSNEPGYYREGHFGIRIENLIVVQKAPNIPSADSRDMLDFETITYVPIDRRLILIEELSRAERGWINQYHAKTLELIAPRVSDGAQRWLKVACAAL
ncbi:aminopeptidase P family protein [Cochlodiniinecator piscidefendens]|uniref:aminopeptidase P family protein n=1 Tax=Cochlodiniinecator piscidefendens TaxID=2715756 RepID=UPI00140BABE4|nr:aminopeptidase P family protein [Cochlodiniinecator piscidefendens]